MRDFFQALGRGDRQSAERRLAPGLTSTSPEMVGVFGTGSPPGITVRDVTAVPGGSNSRLVYRAQLLVVPGANSSPGAWIQGENVRYLELTLTPDGWRINRVSPQPITG